MAETPTTDPAPEGLQFMTGSEGQPDYAIIARHGTVVLGAKPLITVLMTPVGPKGLHIGMRLRATTLGAPHSTDDKVAAFFTQKSWTTAFPGLTFDKADNVRASTMIGVFCPILPAEADKVPAWIKENQTVALLVDWVKTRVPAELFDVDEAALLGWLDQKLTTDLKPGPGWQTTPNVSPTVGTLGEVAGAVMKDTIMGMLSAAGVPAPQSLGTAPAAPEAPKADAPELPSAQVLQLVQPGPGKKTPEAGLSHLEKLKLAAPFKKDADTTDDPPV